MPLDPAFAAALDNSISNNEPAPAPHASDEGPKVDNSGANEATASVMAEALAEVEGGRRPAPKPAAKKEPEAKAKPAPKVKEPEAEEEQPEQETAEPKPEAEQEAEPEGDAEPEAEQEAEEPSLEKAEAKLNREFAEKFNQLAKQETKARKSVEEAKARANDFETKAKAAEEKLAERDRIIAMLETNPLKAFKLLGKDFQKSAKRVVELSTNPSLALQDEIEQTKADVERKLADERKRYDDERKADRERIAKQQKELDLAQGKQYIVDQVKAAGDRWELIRARGLEGKLAQDIADRYEQKGEAVKYAEYLDFVESELEKEADAVNATKRMSKKYRRVEAEEEEPEVEAAPEPEPEPEPEPKPAPKKKAVLAPKPKARKETSGDKDYDAAIEAYLARM